MTDAAHARADLGASIALALSDAEEYMATAEARHKAIGGDVLNPNGDDQRASLGECLLSHRVVCMLRQLAEMVPAPTVVHVARRAEHSPAPAWARASEEVMGGTIGGLARALYEMAKCTSFDLHVSENGKHMCIFHDHSAEASGVHAAMTEIFGSGHALNFYDRPWYVKELP